MLIALGQRPNCLREEAGTALERLKSPELQSHQAPTMELPRLIADLNEEAAEIGAELKTLRTGPRLVDAGFTAMGRTILYGLTRSRRRRCGLQFRRRQTPREVRKALQYPGRTPEGTPAPW